MSTDELVEKVKEHLKIQGTSRDITISDVIQDTMNYCNLTELPIELEPYVRKKVQGIINYETENGTGSVFDVKSIKEGDTSITYNVDEKTSKETIYGLTDRDKQTLRRFRRVCFQ